MDACLRHVYKLKRETVEFGKRDKKDSFFFSSWSIIALNVVLISAVQQPVPAICIHMSLPS